MTAPSTLACPRCSSPIQPDGRFCTECGAPVEGATCVGCGGALTPGAKFCHRCGTAVGALPGGAAMPGAVATPARGPESRLPWIVGSVAALAVVALLVAQTARQAPAGPVTAAAAGAMGSGSGGGGAPPMGAGAAAAAAGGRPAPDISNMSPEERADRLFNRIMTAAEQGDTAQVRFFAPMALTAFSQLPTLDADRRYHYGRVAQVAGDVALAAAQADTILRERPTHLLGLILAADVATTRGDAIASAAFARRLAAAEAAELRANRDEYVQHRAEIDAAVAQAKKN